MEERFSTTDMTLASTRVQPNQVEAEQSILGAMLLDPAAVASAIEQLRPEDFFLATHKEIYSAMMSLYEQGFPVDLVTLMDELRRRGSAEGIGGVGYASALMGSVPSTSNVSHYIRIVHECSVLRRLIRVAADLSDECYKNERSVPEILDRAERAIFDLAMNRPEDSVVHIRPILLATYQQIEATYSNPTQVTGLSTGFTDLDSRTSGLHPSQLILIAARPSMGKSALAMNIAQHVAVHGNVPVLVFSLEMSREEIINRALCSEAMVSLQKVRTGELSDEDWRKIMDAMAPLSRAPIYIDDTPGITVAEIRSKCRKLKIEKGLGLVVVDYLQLMSASGSGGDNRQQQITEISRGLKILARELEVPLIAAAQLSRAPETRGNDHRPILSDIRESGAIEQDADIVMFLYREEYYNPATENRNIAECIIAKQRNGPTGTVKLHWQGEFTRFGNIARNWQE